MEWCFDQDNAVTFNLWLLSKKKSEARQVSGDQIRPGLDGDLAPDFHTNQQHTASTTIQKLQAEGSSSLRSSRPELS